METATTDLTAHIARATRRARRNEVASEFAAKAQPMLAAGDTQGALDMLAEYGERYGWLWESEPESVAS